MSSTNCSAVLSPEHLEQPEKHRSDSSGAENEDSRVQPWKGFLKTLRTQDQQEKAPKPFDPNSVMRLREERDDKSLGG